MAVKLPIESRRTDLHFVNPDDLYVKEELRGRCTPPTDEQIMNMAISLHDHGQIQPILARRDGEKVAVVAGFTRVAASRLLRKGFTFENREYKDELFLIKVSVADCNEEEAFRRNIVENCQRKQTSPVDDAFNQRKLRESYGMSDMEIAALYSCTSAKVGQYRKLLNLSSEEQSLVHEGKMAVSAAIDLLDVDQEKRQEIIEAARKENGKVNGSLIREQIRSVINDDQEDTVQEEPIAPQGSENPQTPEVPVRNKSLKIVKSKSRSMKEVKNFLTSMLENDDESVQKFCKTFLKFIQGSVSSKSVENALKKLKEAA